ncbi:MAG: NAD(P)H-binding protein [Patulibacter sp.]
MIALLGATGRIGRPVAHLLHERGLPVRALVRDPATAGLPVPTVAADLRDPASLRAALRGCERLFLLTPHGRDQDLLEAAAIDAAIAVGVAGIVKISGGAASLSPNGPTSTAVGHWRSEGRIEDSGLEFAHLRPPFLMQNLLEQVAPVARKTGVVVGPFADEPIAMVDAEDVAACAVALLAAPTLGRAGYTITGPRPVTHREIARALNARIVRLPLGVTAAALRARGETPWAIDHAVRMAAFLRSGAAAAPTDAVRRLTGRPAVPIEQFLIRHGEAFSRRRSRPVPVPVPAPPSAPARATRERFRP